MAPVPSSSSAHAYMNVKRFYGYHNTWGPDAGAANWPLGRSSFTVFYNITTITSALVSDEWVWNNYLHIHIMSSNWNHLTIFRVDYFTTFCLDQIGKSLLVCGLVGQIITTKPSSGESIWDGWRLPVWRRRRASRNVGARATWKQGAVTIIIISIVIGRVKECHVISADGVLLL